MKKTILTIISVVLVCMILLSCGTAKDCPAYSKANQTNNTEKPA